MYEAQSVTVMLSAQKLYSFKAVYQYLYTSCSEAQS